MRRINWTRLHGAGQGPVTPIEKPSEKLARIALAAERRHFCAAMVDSLERNAVGDLQATFVAWKRGRSCAL